MTEELMTTQELADYLKVKLGWVYGQTRQRGEGSIPRIRVGKYIRFRLSEVMAWMEGQEKENRTEAGSSDRFAWERMKSSNTSGKNYD